MRDFYDLYYEPEKTKRYLNITGADEPLLFVSTTGGDNDRLFQKALGTEDITNATKESDRLRRAQVSQRKTVQGLHDERLQQIKPLELQYNQATEDFKRIRELEQVLDTEYQRYTQVTSQLEEVDIYTQLGGYYIELLELLNFVEESNINDLVTQLSTLEGHLTQEKHYRELDDAYQALPILDESELSQVPIILQQINQIEGTLQLEQKYEQIKTQLSNVRDDLGEDSLQLQGDFDTLIKLNKTIQTLSSYNALQEQYQQTIVLLTQTEEEYNEARTNLGICPYCQSELGAGHTHH